MKENQKLKENHILIKSNSTKIPCLTTLEPDDRVLTRNLLERGGTGKLANYWKQQTHVTVSSIGEKPVVYKVGPEHDPKRKLRIVERNILMHCDNLLGNYNW